ncbi:MAG: hypothetical protein WC797_00770 [Candidatus Paceibacterota bacterium]
MSKVVPSPEELATLYRNRTDILSKDDEGNLVQSLDDGLWSIATYNKLTLIGVQYVLPLLCFLMFVKGGDGVFLWGVWSVIMAFIDFIMSDRIVCKVCKGNYRRCPHNQGSEPAQWTTILSLSEKIRNAIKSGKMGKARTKRLLDAFDSQITNLTWAYRVWKKENCVAGDKRSELERNVRDIESNLADLGKKTTLPETEFDAQERQRLVSNFEATLFYLRMELERVKKKEREEGTSVDQQIARHISRFMRKEEVPNIISPEGAQAMAEIAMAIDNGESVPDMSDHLAKAAQVGEIEADATRVATDVPADLVGERMGDSSGITDERSRDKAKA